MTRAKQTNESIGYLAAVKVAEPLNVPRVGARVVGKGKLIRTKVCIDFAGAIRGSGRMLAIDFKRDDGVNVYPLSENYLKRHQRDELIKQGRAGAVSGLLVESTRRDRQFWCDWTSLVPERPSVPFEEMLDLGPSSVVADLGKVIAAPTPPRS